MRSRRYSKAKSRNRNVKTGTKAGPVTITKSDGSVVVKPPYGERELRTITKEHSRKIPTNVSRIVYNRDGRCCRYCYDTKASVYELDHVLPFSLGGLSTVRNLVVACYDCNRSKLNKVWKPRPVPKKTLEAEKLRLTPGR